jgi:hypothetical protein
LYYSASHVSAGDPDGRSPYAGLVLQSRNTASRIEDVHELALGMPYVKVDDGT